MSGKNWMKELQKTAMPQLPIALRQMMAKYDTVQEDVLLDIVEWAKDSEFGREHKFDTIKTIEDYRRLVPVSEFSDYSAQIERMKKGGEDILFPGKCAAFAVTTGTTATPKYIPDSKPGELAKSILVKLRAVEMIRMFPHLMEPQYKLFAIANPAVYGKTEGGIPMGSASGQASDAGSMSEKMTSPPALFAVPGLSSENFEKLMIMYAVACKDTAALACDNIAHFHRLLDKLDADHEQIINDIRYGTLSLDLSDELKAVFLKTWHADPERAAELYSIYDEFGTLSIEKIWKNFVLVSCWLSGSVGRTAKEFRNIFPENTVFLEWGYGASEGKFNLITEPETSYGYPAIFGIFFEFQPLDGGAPVLLRDTKEGEKYELVLTSYSGFYRYNIHDVVEIRKDKNGCPTMVFLCKSKDHLEFGDKKFYSSDLTDIIENYEKENSTFLRLFQGEKVGEALRLYVEPARANFDAAAFEAYMKKELDKRGILLESVVRKEDGYRDSLYVKVIESGKTVISTKLAVFIK